MVRRKGRRKRRREEGGKREEGCSTLSTLEPVAGVTVVAVSNVMR